MLYLLGYKTSDSHAYDNLHFHRQVYDIPASAGWKSTCQNTCFHNTEYSNFDKIFSFRCRAFIYIGKQRYNKECTIYWRERCYYNRSLGIEVLCFYCCSCRISLTQHGTENYAKNYPLPSQMVMLKNQISQVRCRVETILRECSENTSFFHHFLYNKGLFYKTVKLNPALMCPLAAAGACLLET